MSKFFGFQNSTDNCWTIINIDNIAVVNKKVGCLPKSFKTITQAQVLVEVGNEIKEYILDEGQYNRLSETLIPSPKHSVGGPG
jgi:hypothetical protein